MSKSLRRWVLFVVVVGAVLALDQTAKWLVVNRLSMGETWVPIPAISSFIRVTRSFNTGAAFGMFPLASNILLALAIITVIAFTFIYPSLPARARLSRISIALIVGGALSNAIDRIRFEHVVDYFHVQLTPAFANVSNFADHAITVGVILLLVDQWLVEREEQRQAAEQPAEPVDGEPPFGEPPFGEPPFEATQSSTPSVD
ncbi:MAG TPA: signal peptidase II [Aggregatilineales bacterium]|nr:signal peptidase II [Aggregatilineales bacterium]